MSEHEQSLHCLHVLSVKKFTFFWYIHGISCRQQRLTASTRVPSLVGSSEKILAWISVSQFTPTFDTEYAELSTGERERVDTCTCMVHVHDTSRIKFHHTVHTQYCSSLSLSLPLFSHSRAHAHKYTHYFHSKVAIL